MVTLVMATSLVATSLSVSGAAEERRGRREYSTSWSLAGNVMVTSEEDHKTSLTIETSSTSLAFIGECRPAIAQWFL